VAIAGIGIDAVVFTGAGAAAAIVAGVANGITTDVVAAGAPGTGIDPVVFTGAGTAAAISAGVADGITANVVAAGAPGFGSTGQSKQRRTARSRFVERLICTMRSKSTSYFHPRAS